MAKLKGYFEEFLDWLHSDITHGRVSAKKWLCEYMSDLV